MYKRQIYGWTNGIVINNGWHVTILNTYVCGSTNSLPPTSSGLGSGSGFAITDCVNCKLSNVTIEFFNYGVNITQPTFTSQGIQIDNILTVQTNSSINNIGSTMYLTNFLFDNGNSGKVTTRETIHIENHLGAGYMTGGQILQDGGSNQIYISNSNGIMISNVDFTNQQHIARSIYVTNSSRNIVATGCLFGGAVPMKIDSGCSQCYIKSNGLFSTGLIDNGSSNYTDLWTGKGCYLNMINGTQTVNDSSLTQVSWNNVVYDDGKLNTAVGLVNVSGGSITSVNVLEGGSNFILSPTISVNGDSGSTGGNVTANLLYGSISSFNVVGSGSGYAGDTSITITPTNGFWHTNNSTLGSESPYIYVPSLFSLKRIRLTASINISGNSGGGVLTLGIWDNTGNLYAAYTGPNNSTGNYITMSTGLIDLNASGNPSRFYVTVYQNSGSSLTIQNSSASNFVMQIEQ